MKKKIIIIFLAWSVVSTPAHADELGKIIGTTLGTLVSVLGFGPADRIIALTAFNQIGGYLGNKVNVAGALTSSETEEPSKSPRSLGNEGKVASLTSHGDQDASSWYARNVAREDSPPVIIAKEKSSEEHEESKKVSFESPRRVLIDI